MKLTHTAAYAIHGMVYIAEHGGDGKPVIGRWRQGNRHPEGFLLRILVALAAPPAPVGEGPNGGYHLARLAKAITLLAIIEAVEGPVAGRADPVSHPPNSLDKRLQVVAAQTTESVRKELARTTLADLLGGPRKITHRRK